MQILHGRNSLFRPGPQQPEKWCRNRLFPVNALIFVKKKAKNPQRYHRKGFQLLRFGESCVIMTGNHRGSNSAQVFCVKRTRQNGRKARDAYKE
jgi:hypothetical protein